jgi:hypothetical protein
MLHALRCVLRVACCTLHVIDLLRPTVTLCRGLAGGHEHMFALAKQLRDAPALARRKRAAELQPSMAPSSRNAKWPCSRPTRESGEAMPFEFALRQVITANSAAL